MKARQAREPRGAGGCWEYIEGVNGECRRRGAAKQVENRGCR